MDRCLVPWCTPAKHAADARALMCRIILLYMVRLKRSNVHSLAALAAVTAFAAALMAPHLPCHWLALAVIVLHYVWPMRSAPFLLIALMPCITSRAGESMAITASVLMMTCSYALYFAAYELAAGSHSLFLNSRLVVPSEPCQVAASGATSGAASINPMRPDRVDAVGTI
jgi:hypothetical protein